MAGRNLSKEVRAWASDGDAEKETAVDPVFRLLACEEPPCSIMTESMISDAVFFVGPVLETLLGGELKSLLKELLLSAAGPAEPSEESDSISLSFSRKLTNSSARLVA